MCPVPGIFRGGSDYTGKPIYPLSVLSLMTLCYLNTYTLTHLTFRPNNLGISQGILERYPEAYMTDRPSELG